MVVNLLRATTVPISLKVLLKGQHNFMQSKGLEVLGVSSAGKDLDDVGENEGIRVEALEMTRTISPIKDLKSLWEFYKLCKREKPAIVHSHTPKAGIVAMLGAWLAGVPIRMHTVAGLPLMEATGTKRKILNLVEKLTYSFATKVYPNSTGLYQFILSEGFAPVSKLKVIASGSSNGIDTLYFSKNHVDASTLTALSAELGLTSDDFVFVFVGRLVGDKGINELVAAFKSLQDFALADNENLKRPKLLLVGPMEADLDPLKPETIQEISSNSGIVSAGYQSDVRPYLAVSDALVFPSYREGFPNVVMQAGAMELPSIVSNINGCNEVVVEGVNGTIIPAKSSDALLAAMRRFIEEPEYVGGLKANARRMITERYEQQVVWNALLEEYQKLLKEKGIEFTPCINTSSNV